MARSAAMMRFAALAVLGLLVAVAGPAQAQSAATGEPRLALVIGNAAYDKQALKNPANDARAVAQSLRKLGFTVIERIDAGKKAMEDAILEFGEKLRAGGIGLFYYAGHGVQVRGHNYLVPLDASLPSEASVRVQAVDVDLVLEQMTEARNRANVVILDACRNNPFMAARRGAGAGLAAIDAARGTLIAYSTAPGTVAVDGGGANSPYTASLVRAIEQPGLTVEELFKRVRATVIEATQGVQTPWESSSLTGDLVLNLNVTINVPPASATPASATPAPANTQAAQVAFWESMGKSSNPGDYEDYLRQFPDGIYAGLAKRRIADLKRSQQAAAPATAPAPASAPTPAQKPAPAAAPARPPAPAPAPASAPVTQAAPPPSPYPPPSNTQQAALPPPAAPSPVTPDDFDGTWSGASGPWKMELVVRNGDFSGRIGCYGSDANFSGKLGPGGTVNATAMGNNVLSRRLNGKLPTISIGDGGQCGGTSITLVRPDTATARAPSNVQAAAAPAPAPSASNDQLRQRSYERVITILLGQTVATGTDQGRRNDYRGAPRPKAIAACIDWSDGSPDALRVGSWASSWIPPGAVGTPPRQDALEKCTRGNNTPERCACQVVDENDGNALELPQDFQTRALRR